MTFPRKILKSIRLRAVLEAKLPCAVVIPVGNERPSVAPDISDIEVADVPIGKIIG